MGCASNLDSPNQPAARETQFTLAPIPKKIHQSIYPEYGSEARYERVLIIYDVKNAYLKRI
jgi:hypothetical protein